MATPLVTPLPPMPLSPMEPAVMRMEMMAMTTSISTKVKAALIDLVLIGSLLACMGFRAG